MPHGCSAHCCLCHERIDGASYRSAVQLKTERSTDRWRQICEDCLDECEIEYMRRSDYLADPELQKQWALP